MKRIVHLLGILAISGFLSSCVSDVSKQPPYNQLVGTTWRLKTDAFVVKYYDTRKSIVVPCVKEESIYLPSEGDWEYSEEKFGRNDGECMIQGGLRSGQLLYINRVEKHPSFEMSTSYIPIGLARDKNGNSKEYHLDLLYDSYTHGQLNPEGKLNPKYAERVK